MKFIVKSPACSEWPLMQPASEVWISTKGFFAEPVAWQMVSFPLTLKYKH